MPYLDSELNDAGTFALIPNSTQNAHVYENEYKQSKGGAPMSVLGWLIEEGEFAGRKIRFDNIMLGGLSKDGKPLSLGQLCSFLHYTGTIWSCGHCSHESTEKHGFLIVKKETQEEGLKIGNYYCPECKNPKPRIKFDTDTFMGARCGISIGSQKQEGTDREFNIVRGYTDLIS
jgi:hypothetical protein